MPELSYFHFGLHCLPQGKKPKLPPFNMNLLACKPLTLQLPSETYNHALPQLAVHPVLKSSCITTQRLWHSGFNTISGTVITSCQLSQYPLVCSTGPIFLTFNFAIKFEFGPTTVHPLLGYSCKSVLIIMFLHGFMSAECIDLQHPINRMLCEIWWIQDILYKNILVHYFPLFG